VPGAYERAISLAGDGVTAPKPQILLNAAANGLGFAAQLVVAFFLSPILVHGLGDARNGIWSLVESILAYLMLFDLGVAASVVRHVARFEATRDRDHLNRVFCTSVCIFAAAGALALAITLTLAFPGFRWFNLPDDMAGEARWMFVLLGCNLAVGLPMGVFPCVLDGLGRFPVKTAIRTSVLVARVPLFLVVMHKGAGLIGIACAITACNLAEYLLLAVAACWYLPQLRFSFRLADRATFRAIRGYSLNAFLAMIAGRVSFQTDALVIGLCLAAAPITYFAIAARLVEYAKNALRAVTTVLTPAVSTLEARGDDDGIRTVLLDSTRHVLWLIVPIEVGLLMLGAPFLALWMGEKYAELSFPTLAILAAPLALAMAQSVAARVLYGVGKLRWFARAMLLEAGCNLVLSLALVKPLGIEGVALGTSIPNFIMDIVIIVAVCRMFGVRVRTYAWRTLTGPCAAGLLLAAGWWFTGAAQLATNWAAWVVVGAAGAGGFATLAAVAEGHERIIRLAGSLWRARAPTLTAGPQLNDVKEMTP
jgi:O-antigen/teichoic acid export membrane protein